MSDHQSRDPHDQSSESPSTNPDPGTSSDAHEAPPGAQTPEDSPEAAAPSPLSGAASGDDLRERVVEALKTVFDPEIPVDIYELGLIYEIDIDPQAFVSIKMTLTSPGCPEAVSLPPQVESRVKEVPEVSGAKVEVVWEPMWTPERMSEAAKLQLGMF